MPEVRRNDDPLPRMNDQKLMNVLMIAPWTSQWDGSAGTCRIHENKIVVAYVKGKASEEAMRLVKLRLNTEMKVPEDQILFEPMQKRVIS